MKGQKRLVTGSMVFALATSLLLVEACGSGGGGGGGTACGPMNDNITAQLTQITVSSTNLSPPSCEVLTIPGTSIVADSGGDASVQFGGVTGNVANCAFQQLGSATGGTPKTATFTSRDPSDPMTLFRVTNGDAACTINGVVLLPLCGQAKVFTDGSIDGTSLLVDCNNDPMVSVAVYRGGATVSFEKLPGSPKVHVSANDEIIADLFTNTINHKAPQFTANQISLFDVQLDALASGVALTDQTSLLHANKLSGSGVVVNPNLLQTQLGQAYGNVGTMCKQTATIPVVFFPADPRAKTPQVYGGVCGNKVATVYGVAAYRQRGLGFSGPFFKVTGGGSLLRSDAFRPAITLTQESPKAVFAWNGAIEPSTFANSDVYVLKFIYSLPPDTTLRVAFVAVSLFGAPYPAQIQ